MTEDESKKEIDVGGRPSEYTLDMGKRICEAIASSPYGYRRISRENKDFPAIETMRRWRYRYPEFRALHEEAVRIRAAILLDDVLDIEEERHDTLNKEGIEVVDQVKLADKRLRINNRLRMGITKTEIQDSSTVSQNISAVSTAMQASEAFGKILKEMQSNQPSEEAKPE